MKRLDEERTRFAYHALRELRPDDVSDLEPILAGLPAQIRAQGLPLALALLGGKPDRKSQWVIKLLERWHSEKNLIGLLKSGTPAPESTGWLLERLIDCDRSVYRAVQADALALLEKAKVLCRALKTGYEASSQDRGL